MLASQRELFDVPREVCYFNAAGWSPLPLATIEAARKAVARKGQPWLIDAEFQAAQYERTRRAAARLVNAEPADVALISSVAYGVATATKVLRVPKGSRVLVLEDDHSSPVLEWMTRAEAEGIHGRHGAPPRQRRLDRGGAGGGRSDGGGSDRGRLDLVDPLVGRRQDRPGPRRPCAQGARCGAPRRCHARRRRHGARRRARSIPTSWCSRPTSGCSVPTGAPFSMWRSATRAASRWSRRATAGARCAPSRTSTSRTRRTWAMPGASTWASAITSSPWRWRRWAWSWSPAGGPIRSRSVSRCSRGGSPTGSTPRA